MKNIKSFTEFVNESKVNEAKPYTLDIEGPDSWESQELMDWVINSLGAKNPKEVCILDEDEPTDKKAYDGIANKVTDWEKNKEFSDFDDWYYSKSHNVVKCDAGGYMINYCLVKDLKKLH
jgi:hypothetical protein